MAGTSSDVTIPAEAARAALPGPSLTEPFAIGEALHDPNRVADAVVSMLGLIGVETIADDGTGQASASARGLLTESEVRALIQMGKADADAPDADQPRTVKNRHSALAVSLPNVSVETFAELIARHFAQRPDDPVEPRGVG